MLVAASCERAVAVFSIVPQKANELLAVAMADVKTEAQMKAAVCRRMMSVSYGSEFFGP